LRGPTSSAAMFRFRLRVACAFLAAADRAAFTYFFDGLAFLSLRAVPCFLESVAPAEPPAGIVWCRNVKEHAIEEGSGPAQSDQTAV